MRFLQIFTLMFTLFMTACTTKASSHDVEVVTPQEFQERLGSDSEAYLLDVRKPDEYEAGHIAGAHLLNWLDTDNFNVGSEKLDKSKTICVYCRSGRRSSEAAGYLAGQGFKVVDLDGGILAWEKEGLPIFTSPSR